MPKRQLYDAVAECYADPLRFVPLLCYPWGEPGLLESYSGPDAAFTDLLNRALDKPKEQTLDVHVARHGSASMRAARRRTFRSVRRWTNRRRRNFPDRRPMRRAISALVNSSRWSRAMSCHMAPLETR